MDLSTTYLGLKLRSPLVASASPYAKELDTLKQMADSGASAIVLNSLYEEEIRLEREALMHHLEHGTDSYAEALSYFPEPETFYAKTDTYLKHLFKAQDTVDVPIIASLNGSTLGGWTNFAKKMQEAGASAIELNIYNIPTDINQSGAEVEQMYIDIVKAVKESITIPVAVKLSPYFSNTANMAKRLVEAGADALVLFNRFYQPDIDLETLEPIPNIILSTPFALRLPFQWIGILYGRVKTDFAATSGIHTAEDAIKVLLAGANVACMTSAILKNGTGHFATVENGLKLWMEANDYESIEQMIGSVSQIHSPDPSAFERAQYMRGLRTYSIQS